MMKKHFEESVTLRRAQTDALRLGRICKSVLAFNPVSETFIPRRQICISMGIDFLSIAHGTRVLNRIRIMGYKTYRFQDLRCPSPEIVASTASLYCRHAKLKNPQVTLCVPKAWSVIQATELPATARENLPDVVAYELDRITPFGPDDAYYDYRILKEENGRLQIAITALRRDAIDPYMKALAEKGLPVTQIDTNLAAVSTYLNYVRQEQDIIYLDIFPGTYEGGFLQSGVVVAGCSGSFNGKGPDESVMTDVAEEVSPWIAKLKGQAVSPRMMVHSHAGVLYSSLERQIQIPIQVLKDGDLMIPGFKGERTDDDIPHDAIGGVLASLWAKSKAMNLLRPGRARSGKPPLAPTIILIAALLLMGALALGLPLYLDYQKVSMIDQELSARKGEIKKIETLRKEYNSLHDEHKAVMGFKQSKPQALKILKELTVILPKSVWLTRIHINEANVSIEGYATSATDILPLIEASPHFTKVEFSSPTIRDGKMNADRFVIRTEIEGMKKEEPKTTNGKKR
jgi:general secretion pathway protein L